MRTANNEKITHIRPAFGSIRHIKVHGETMYREARRHDVQFEIPFDETAWDLCGPQPRQEPIELP